MGEHSELEQSKAALIDLREQLLRILGTTTTDLIMERAAIEVIHTYPAMALIRFGESAPDFTDMDTAFDGTGDEDVRAAFGALRGVVLLVLARLLGKEMTNRLVPSDPGFAKMFGGSA